MNLLGMSPPGIASFEIATWVSFGSASASLVLSTITGRKSLKAGTLRLTLTRMARGLATVALLPAAMIFISTMLRVLMTPNYLWTHPGSVSSAQWVLGVFSPIGFLLLLALNAWMLAAHRLDRAAKPVGAASREDGSGDSG